MTGTTPTTVSSQHHEKVANEKGEHILQMVYLMRGLLSKLYKDFMQFNGMKTNNPTTKWVQNLSTHTLKEDIDDQKVYLKKKKIKSSTSLVIWKRQIKTKIRYHLTPVRMFMIKRQKIANPGSVSRKGKPCALWLGR